MTTTQLFVELIVIGIGTILWLGLLISGFLGHSWISMTFLSSAASIIPLLSLAYVFGIVTDRIAQMLLDRPLEARYQRYGVTQVHDRNHEDDRVDLLDFSLDTYNRARWQISYVSERFSNRLNYTRTRVRVCRGWIVNTILLLIAFNIFVWNQIDQTQQVVGILGNTLLIILLVSLFFSWRALVLLDVRNVAELNRVIAKYNTQRPNETLELL